MPPLDPHMKLHSSISCNAYWIGDALYRLFSTEGQRSTLTSGTYLLIIVSLGSTYLVTKTPGFNSYQQEMSE